MGAFRERVKKEVASHDLPVLIEITKADRAESKEKDGSAAQTDWLIGEARLACAGIHRVLVVPDGKERLRISSYTPDELR